MCLHSFIHFGSVWRTWRQLKGMLGQRLFPFAKTKCVAVFFYRRGAAMYWTVPSLPERRWIINLINRPVAIWIIQFPLYWLFGPNGNQTACFVCTRIHFACCCSCCLLSHFNMTPLYCVRTSAYEEDVSWVGGAHTVKRQAKTTSECSDKSKHSESFIIKGSFKHFKGYSVFDHIDVSSVWTSVERNDDCFRL